MGAEVEHRAISVEDILRPVAVVDVPVGNQDAADAVFSLRVAGADGDVVEDAEAHAFGRRCVVSRRTDDAEGVPGFSPNHSIHTVQNRAGSPERYIPRTMTDAGV